MPSRWARRGASWRNSPRTETPGGSWSAAYVPDGTTGEDEKIIRTISVRRFHDD